LSGLFNCDCTALKANGRKQGCGVLWCGHAGSVKIGCLVERKQHCGVLCRGLDWCGLAGSFNTICLVG